jgi:sRNA-binding regulator protein Hfq
MNLYKYVYDNENLEIDVRAAEKRELKMINHHFYTIKYLNNGFIETGNILGAENCDVILETKNNKDRLIMYSEKYDAKFFIEKLQDKFREDIRRETDKLNELNSSFERLKSCNVA